MKRPPVRLCTGFCTASDPSMMGNAGICSVYGGGFESRLAHCNVSR